MTDRASRPATLALGAALATIAALGVARPLAAQTSDDDWLADCRRQNSSGDWDGDRRERFCEVRVERLRAGGRLTLDGRENGSVQVRGGSAGGTVVHARIAAEGRSAADAQATARAVRIVTTDNRVQAEGPDRGRGRHWYVSYLVETPSEADLDVTTHNGSVSVRGVSGRMELSATNGSMSLAEVGGDVRARTQNGSLNVRLAGRQWRGRGLDAETRNGSVRLDVPDGYNAHLETGTVNGRFNSEIPLTVQGRIGERISTNLGDGGPTIRARTTNGSVSLRRGEVGSRR
jgi:hypothetical protein